MLLSLIVAVVAAAVWAATLFGLLAPFWPVAEFGNHFRPFILAGTLVVFLIALLVGKRARARLFAAAALANAALLVAPAYLAPPMTSSAGEGRRVSLITFNAWVGNSHLDNAVAYLRAERADVVLLQEMDASNEATVLPALADIYPHTLSCVAVRHCGLVLLARHPWEEASFQPAGNGVPRVIRARFGSSLNELQVIGTHLAYPLQPELQARNAEWFSDHAARLSGAVVVAGDFNLTPWSWRLFRFARRTGLRRIGTWRNSWPAPRFVLDVPFSAFLIDHVFLSHGVALEDWKIGPAIGSDHLPVRADLRIEPSAGQDRVK